MNYLVIFLVKGKEWEKINIYKFIFDKILFIMI